MRAGRSEDADPVPVPEAGLLPERALGPALDVADQVLGAERPPRVRLVRHGWAAAAGAPVRLDHASFYGGPR